MAAHRLTFPVDEAAIRELRAGDELIVDGHIIGIRDRTQIRIFDQGQEPPIDLRGALLLHTAPNVRKIAEGAARGAGHQEGRALPGLPSETTGRTAVSDNPAISRNRYEKICIGTTTSARMVRFTEGLGERYGVRAICGKGGLPDEAIEPMRRLGMAYLAIVGGAAALETTQIEEIEEVAWEELMPECLWKFRVRDFGPLTVAIDSHGNSVYHDVQERAKARLEEIYGRL